MSKMTSYGTAARRRKSGKARWRKKTGLFLLLLVLIFAGMKFVSGSEEIPLRILAEKLEREKYPQSLVDLMVRNPETKQFVMDYADHAEADSVIDLSGDVRDGEIPLFLQWDERWGYKMYGDDFLAVTGCGPTCLSMVYCGLSGDTRWNPYEVAQMAEENGYYVEGAGSSWDLMSRGAEKMGLISETVVFDEAHIRKTLEEGHPIICSVGPGDFTSAGHFIVLCGIKENGRILVHDPNSKKNSSREWETGRLMSQIKNLWSYSLR